jgi:BirA family transcriptional regulator, biotin operon repressor / biotin---[acetyl-CoA-carboxylase] ligase
LARYRDGGSREGAVLSVTVVAETGSTNADLLASGGAEGDWLVADCQTAGRGRMGRAWESPPGNLYASTLVSPLPDDPPASTLGLVAAVALRETFAGFIVAPGRLQLKWPNDVLAKTDNAIWAKISGILLERNADTIVIGIGANLAHHPLTLDRPVTSIAALGVPVPTRDAFLAVLVGRFAAWRTVWRESGLSPVRSAWLDYAHPVGTPLNVALPDGEWLNGAFDGLDPDCALRLRLADGQVRVIHAGDVLLV